MVYRILYRKFRIVIFALIPCLAFFLALELIQRVRHLGFYPRAFYYHLSSSFSEKESEEKLIMENLKEGEKAPSKISNQSFRPQITKSGTHSSGMSQGVYLYKSKEYEPVDGTYYYKGLPGNYSHRFVNYKGESQTTPYKINSLGFRSSSFTAKKNKGFTRIIVTGASSVMGLENSDDQTFPAFLKKVLTSKYPNANFDVINAGFLGYSSNDILTLLKHELTNYEPDIIINYSAYNDTAHGRFIALKKISFWGIPFIKMHQWLNGHSLFYTTISEKWALWRTGSPIPEVRFKDRYRDVFVKNMKSVIDICKVQGIRLIFVLQPLSIPTGLSQLESGMSPDDLAGFNPAIGFWESALERQALRQKVLLAELLQMAQSTDVKVIDPLLAFEKKRLNGERLFHDIVHLTPKGTSFLAHLIANSNLIVDFPK